MVSIKTKTQAAAIFGNYSRLGRALGVTKGAISQWPEKLNTRQQNEVMGAALRAGLMPHQ
jgi:hypothetical protein